MLDRTTVLHSLRRAAERLRVCERGPAGPSCGDELVHLRRTLDLLELEFARTAAQFAATDEYDRAGYCTPIHWMRNECNTSSSIAGNAVAVGEQQAKLPQAIRAMEERKIGFPHLALLARTAEHLTMYAGQEDFDERPLLRKAMAHTVSRFRKDCAHARHAADQQFFLQEHVDAVESRFLEVKPRDDGCVWLRGFLDSVAGASLRTALDALSAPDGASDVRSRERRQADALIDIVDRALDSGRLPGHGGQRPHLQVTASVDTLRALDGADAGEMQLAGAVPAATVQRIACDASIARVLIDRDSAVLDVSRARRLPAAATRRALLARDKGCVWPGCERPAPWTQAHHLVHWSHGGPTELSNLALVCRRHHWMLHEAGWQMVRGGEGGVTLVPPLPGYTPKARAPAAAVA